ncbi:tetratricopeptide repeat protein [Burkholderiaceae bacterium DAT-1]|nr:tetratricopeptide repeat protein [Burkholderiaceae bacterium DAT-1]
MDELPSIIAEPVEALIDAGDKLFEKGKYAPALEKYREALALLPTDRTQYVESAYVLAAVGDTLYLMGEIAEAMEILDEALDCPEAEVNAFILLRLGQCLYDSGDKEAAAEVLATAFALGGEELFEDEEPQYRKLVQEDEA